VSKSKKERKRQETIILTKKMATERVNFQYLYQRAGLGQLLLRRMKAALDVHAAVLDNARMYEAKVRGSLDEATSDYKKTRSPKKRKMLQQLQQRLQKQLDEVGEDIAMLDTALSAMRPVAEKQQDHTTRIVHNLASAEAKYAHERWKPVREMIEKEQERRKNEGPKKPANLFADVDPKSTFNVFAIPVPLLERDNNDTDIEETSVENPEE
jgi:hypothetical protein